MALFIPGTINAKRRRAAMQSALYTARKNRLVRLGGGEDAGPPPSATWNPATFVHGALSNSNLTYTTAHQSSGGAMGMSGASAGKRMVSFSVLTDGGQDITSLDYVGVGPANFQLNDVNGGAQEFIILPSGKCYSEAQVADFGNTDGWPGFWVTHPTALRIDLIIDFTAGTAYARYAGLDWNASALANPTTGVGGIALGSGTVGKALFPVVRLADDYEHVTLNTQPDNLPSGVTVWGG